MSGFVYAIECGDAVKLGFAQDPWRRLSELNVGHPGSHRLIGYAGGTKDDERQLHRLCVDQRIRGEWFRKDGTVLHFLNLVPKAVQPEPKPVHLPQTTDADHISCLVEQAIAIVGTQAKLALAAGISQPSINEAKKKGRVGARLAAGIDRATGSQVSKSDLRPDLWPRDGAAA